MQKNVDVERAFRTLAELSRLMRSHWSRPNFFAVRISNAEEIEPKPRPILSFREAPGNPSAPNTTLQACSCSLGTAQAICSVRYTASVQEHLQ
jgi:hypothetical protein